MYANMYPSKSVCERDGVFFFNLRQLHGGHCEITFLQIGEKCSICVHNRVYNSRAPLVLHTHPPHEEAEIPSMHSSPSRTAFIPLFTTQTISPAGNFGIASRNGWVRFTDRVGIGRSSISKLPAHQQQDRWPVYNAAEMLMSIFEMCLYPMPSGMLKSR